MTNPAWTTTYVGPGCRGLLYPGQRVIRTERGIRYDLSDPTVLLCDESPLTTITGVPESDLVDEQWAADEQAERAWKR